LAFAFGWLGGSGGGLGSGWLGGGLGSGWLGGWLGSLGSGWLGSGGGLASSSGGVTGVSTTDFFLDGIWLLL